MSKFQLSNLMQRLLLIFLILNCSLFIDVHGINVIPYPYEYDINPSYRYEFNEQSAIVCKHKSLVPVAELFSKQIAKSTGINLPILKRSKNAIYLYLDKKAKNPEAYSLYIYTNGREIYGGSPAGVYHS